MKLNDKPKDCLIYCRVSSTKQVNDGDGLGSQEQRCRAYAQNKGYRVEKVFRDKGISGGLFERPAIQELLNYLDEKPHKNYVVLFDDLSRFARDVSVHLKLKIELVEARKVKLECLNFNFEDTPEGKFIETIIAGKAELDRSQNQRQVIQKQKARLEGGYWAFGAILGYKQIKTNEHGKLLHRIEPHASIYAMAFEGYAHHLLNSQTEVIEFINQKFKAADVKKTISKDAVYNLLKRVYIYAGFVEYPKWEVARKKGHHKGIISKETARLVAEKLEGRSKPRSVKSFSEYFPLRNFARCTKCNNPLTASWNKGRSEYYGNYWCKTKGCEYRYKTTRMVELHPMFEDKLIEAKICTNSLALTQKIFEETWEQMQQESAMLIQSLENKLEETAARIGKLSDKIETAKTLELEEVYETRLQKALNEKKQIEEQIKNQPQYNQQSFGTSFNRVKKVLNNPLTLWDSANLEDQKTILYMYFDQGLYFDYYKGFGTAKFSESLEVLKSLGDSEEGFVEMPGSDPGSAIAL